MALKEFAKRGLFTTLPRGRQKQLGVSLLREVSRHRDELDVARLDELRTVLEVIACELEDEARRKRLCSRGVPERPSESTRHVESTSIMDPDAPWRRIRILPTGIPSMISDEEAQYYEFIGSRFTGRGELVELGPWLGRSTTHIVRGLKSNPRFADRRLHVYDDFVWRSSWMNRHYPLPDRPKNHACFRWLFDRYTRDIARYLELHHGRIFAHDGNESLPQVGWDGGPIEIMYIDCGRTLEANEGWWSRFQSGFVPGVTLLIMQDWRTHRERPRKAYNQTLQFTAAHAEQLEMLHEVSHGGVGTFLYVG